MSLRPVLVRVRQRVENDGVRFDTIPPLRTRYVLHKIQPVFRFGQFFVFPTVPFGDLYLVSQTPQNLQFVVEIVEDHLLRMVLEQFLDCPDAARIAVDDSSQNAEELRYVLDRSILVDMPSILDYALYELLVVLYVLCDRVPNRCLRIWHMHKDLIPEL